MVLSKTTVIYSSIFMIGEFYGRQFHNYGWLWSTMISLSAMTTITGVGKIVALETLAPPSPRSIFAEKPISKGSPHSGCGVPIPGRLRSPVNNFGEVYGATAGRRWGWGCHVGRPRGDENVAGTPLASAIMGWASHHCSDFFHEIWDLLHLTRDDSSIFSSLFLVGSSWWSSWRREQPLSSINTSEPTYAACIASDSRDSTGILDLTDCYYRSKIIPAIIAYLLAKNHPKQSTVQPGHVTLTEVNHGLLKDDWWKQWVKIDELWVPTMWLKWTLEHVIGSLEQSQLAWQSGSVSWPPWV